MIPLTYHEALVLYPEILEIKKATKHWNDSTDKEFFITYFTNLKHSELFAEREGGELKHFVYVDLEDKENPFIWLLYSHKRCANTTETRDFVNKIKSHLKFAGVKTITFTTTNTRLSYERFVGKLGAFVVEKTFKATL